jgi:tetratricopeptide (TPR) repeat protein
VWPASVEARGRARRLGIAATLALMLAAHAAAAQPRPVPGREQALADLRSADAEARRRAAAWLGEFGIASDAAALLGALRDPDPTVRALAEGSVWQVWSRSGDAEVDRLFAIGLEQMTQGAAATAVETFSEVIRRKPDFAEGWNKRATIYFLVGEYEKSLRDCDEVIRRNPEHFGALAGYGQIYLRLDRPDLALQYFERALRVNPNLAQVELMVEQLRHLLIQRRRGTI